MPQASMVLVRNVYALALKNLKYRVTEMEKLLVLFLKKEIQLITKKV